MRGNNRDNPGPYGTARDLPRFAEMQQLLTGMKLISGLVGTIGLSRKQRQQQRQQLEVIEHELTDLINLVDRFYETLGPRNWIFTEHLLPFKGVRELLADSPASDVAETGLIEIIANHIESPHWHLGIFGHEAMQARRQNLERARQHYQQEQWDSCTLVLITVIDGFVNDVEKFSRRGLHARGPHEMVAWDSVSGHHMGLTSVTRVFQQSFRKRQDKEVFEVHRHGIVHGMIVKYNNKIVATKAWNILAAVVDWAESKEKAAAIAGEKDLTSPSVFDQLMDNARRSQYKKTFTESAVTAADPRFRNLEVVQSAQKFLDSWQKERWAPAAEALPNFGNTYVEPDKRAVEAKNIYGRNSLTEFEITHVHFPSPSVAIIKGTATIDDVSRLIEMRWMRERTDGRLGIPDDINARWVLAVYPPDSFIKDYDAAEED